MKRVRSGLDGNGMPVIMAVGFSLFLILCVCFVMGYHSRPRFGYSVRPSATHFVMGEQDRDKTHFLTIGAGDVPSVYWENREIPEGIGGVERELQRLDGDVPSEVVVVLVADEAVSSGVLREVADMILSHGFVCHIAGRPRWE